MFYDRILLKMTLKPIEPGQSLIPLLVGKGVEPGENVREPLVLDVKDGNTYKRVALIPGSTIKGILRTTAYAIAKTMIPCISDPIVKHALETHSEELYAKTIHDLEKLKNGDPQLYARLAEELSDPNTRVLVRETLGVDNNTIDNVVDSLNKGKILDDYSQIIDFILAYNCPIDRLFGSKYFKGKLSVKTILLEIDGEKTRTGTRYHVAIDRMSQKNLEQSLYEDHLIYLKEIPVEITILEIDEASPEYKLLEHLKEYIQKIGVHIGTSKSTGYGPLKAETIHEHKISYSKLHEEYKKNNHNNILRKLTEQT